MIFNIQSQAKEGKEIYFEGRKIWDESVFTKLLEHLFCLSHTGFYLSNLFETFQIYLLKGIHRFEDRKVINRNDLIQKSHTLPTI